MGVIARLLSFARRTVDGAKVSEATVDPAGGDNLTTQHFAPPGDDSHPLPGDTVVAVRAGRSGEAHAVGYMDTENAGQAAAGEKRLYSRDSNGAPVAEVWLKADGQVVVRSVDGAVSMTMDPAAGRVSMQAAIVEIDGDSVVLAGGALPIARQTDPVTAGPYAGTITAGAPKSKAG